MPILLILLHFLLYLNVLNTITVYKDYTKKGDFVQKRLIQLCLKLICCTALHAEHTLEEKIAQMLIIGVPVDPTPEQYDFILPSLTKHKPGGIIFLSKGTIAGQINATKKFQALADVPLLICEDLEWGLAMRLTDGFNFPKNNIIGFTSDPDLVTAFAHSLAQQCKQLSIHVNCAPVLDINSNENNPIIGSRSFSADKEVVATYAQAFVAAFDQHNVFCCAKHFPGHGDTETDSHLGLPTIKKTLQELEAIELYPFKKAIEQGIQFIMMAHIMVPALDAAMPASLSKKTIDYLRTTLNFNGMVMSDALNMQAITNMYPQPHAAAVCLAAGTDMVILASDKPGLVVDKLNDPVFYEATIEEAIQEIKKLLTPKQIDEKYKKIIAFKEKNIQRTQDIPCCPEHFLTKEMEDLTQTIYTKAIQQSLSFDVTPWQKKALVINQKNYTTITQHQFITAQRIVIKLKGTQKGFNLNNCEFDQAYKEFVQSVLKNYRDKTLLVLYANQLITKQFNAQQMIIAFEKNKYTKKIIHDIGF